jgi:hypothetical protein
MAQAVEQQKIKKERKKKDEIMLFAVKWMDLKVIMLIEINQSQKT